jgi:glycosyltransferase involved in cell wall biosynthesis
MEKVKTKQYMVCVNCMTFNHANFIEDAMNGFCMQQTNFPFVCVIVDDASTDGEPAVIQKYIDCNFDLQNKSVVRNEETDDYVLTFAQHKTNKNCYFAVLLLKYNHYRKKDKKPYYAEWQDNAKYVALCEGDDYWINHLKLQMQVNFLENHPGYMMCFHRAYLRFENNTKLNRVLFHVQRRDYTGIEIAKKWIVATASVLFRKDILLSGLMKKVITNKNFIYGDLPLFLVCAHYGKIYGMEEVMSVYRRVNTSVTHIISYRNSIKYANHSIEISKVFGDVYSRIAKKNYVLSLMTLFFRSLFDFTIRIAVLKRCLSVSVPLTLLSVPLLFLQKVKSRL